jgi:hypothetical protein
MPTNRQNIVSKKEIVGKEVNPRGITQNEKNKEPAPPSPLWFTNILIFGNNTLGLYLSCLKKICSQLLGICKIITVSMLLLTALYALVVWKHFPAAEPRDLLVGWAICLMLTNLGYIALEGRNTTKLAPSLVLILIMYWMPVAKLSKILQHF